MSEHTYSIGGTGHVPEANTFVNPVAGTKIFLRRSDTQGKKPVSGDAEYGELFINYHSNSPMLCFKDNANNIVEIRPLTEVELAIGELTDVDVSGVSSGMVLAYNGSIWTAVSPGSLTVDVDLGYTGAADRGTVTNSAGDDAVIPLANGSTAGLSLNDYTTADKTKLAGLPDPGDITDGTVTSVDSGNGLTGGPITDAGTLSVQADGDTITVGAAGIKVTDGKFAAASDLANYLELAGGNMTGGVTATVRTIVAGASGFDLATGNLWECGGIAVPNPTNAVAGMTGVIVFTAAPTAFGSNFKFPGGSAIAPSSFPAVAPFYVRGSSEILIGNAVEGIA